MSRQFSQYYNHFIQFLDIETAQLKGVLLSSDVSSEEKPFTHNGQRKGFEYVLMRFDH